ncbi:hypothetical protein BGZ83_007840 [Gryganskiella cystojenkinii]|nr:hypothetical protein BGZ83_007840 [Gryganskiella cystojenkinii]
MPSREAASRNGGFVRKLEFLTPVKRDYIADSPYRKLESLTFHLPLEYLDPWQRNLHPIPTPFVLNNRDTLRDIKVAGITADSCLQLWHAIASVPNLRRLELQDICFRGQKERQAFWRMCTRAEVLDLQSLEFEEDHDDFVFSKDWGENIFSRSSRLYPLKSVYIRNITCNYPTYKRLIRLLVDSPGLRSLVMRGNRNSTSSTLHPLSTLSDASILSPHGLNLIKLDIQGYHVTDDRMSVLLRSLSCGLEILNASETGFGPDSVRVLIENHLCTMAHLDLSGCGGVTSPMLHTILFTHPRLISIKAGRLLASDLLEDDDDEGEDVCMGRPRDQDWVCKDLVVWDIDIIMDEQEPENYARVFDRLAGLTKLKVLKLSRDSNPETPQLTFEVDLGAKLLESLQDLEELQFDQRQISVEDWSWILESFPQLQRIKTCRSLIDDEREEMLAIWMSFYDRIQFDFEVDI